MNDKTRPILFMGGLIILALALAGCKPTQTVSVANTIEAAVFPYEITEPGIGSSMTWVDGSLFMYVPPGEFIMGQDAPSEADYSPAHPVNLAGFWIHQSEVTNGMYAQCVAAGACSAPFQIKNTPYWYGKSSYASYPVVGVDYNQAAAYCDWIQGLLPTEAQSEKAGRGVDGKTYPWGEAQPNCSLLNFAGCLPIAQPARIHSYANGESIFKLGDTAGNIFEWARDWYAKSFYSISPADNPLGPAQGTERVVRSSSYLTGINDLAIYLRDSLKPVEYRADLGFRCILTGEAAYNPPPPMCTEAGYVPPSIVTQPTPITGTVSATANCWCREGNGMCNVTFSEDITEDQYNVTSDAGPVSTLWNGATPNMLTVQGAGIPPGGSAFLTICPTLASPPLPPETPLCPSGYEFDPADDLCHYALAPGGAGECDAAHHFVTGYGCMPIFTGTCPAGWFKAFPINPGDPIVCLPWGGPAACVDNPDCSGNQICPVGIYVPEQDCCDIPDNVTPLCNAGYTYNSTFHLCYPDYSSSDCITIPAIIVDCDQQQDDGDGTNDGDVGQPTNPCSQYGDKDSCRQNGCTWTLTDPYSGKGYCH